MHPKNVGGFHISSLTDVHMGNEDGESITEIACCTALIETTSANGRTRDASVSVEVSNDAVCHNERLRAMGIFLGRFRGFRRFEPRFSTFIPS